MAYDAYRPQGGYNARRGAAAKSAALLAAENAGLAQKEGTFSELPVTRGVGPYHVNHFISYGALLPLSSPVGFVEPLARRFYERFEKIFEPNVAEAEKRAYLFQGAVTIEFSIGGDEWDPLQELGGLLHSDWVSLRKSDGGESFHASTLRRGWLTKTELFFLGGLAGSAPGLIDEALEYIRVNQHHFLAGRRSFRFGYDAALQRPYVDTAALERSSLCEYYLFEKTGALRATIIDIWTKLIRNVREELKAIKWIAPKTLPDQSVRAGYQTTDDVDYRTRSFETAAQALADPWFAKVLTRHPGLVQ